jgi:hypothetical protein
MRNNPSFDWDEQLSSPGQEQIREAVRALPDETPSLAWRSALNAALQNEAARRRRRVAFGWVWKPSAGLALAAGLALIVIAKLPSPTPTPRTDAGIERATVNSYLNSKSSWELTGDGLTTNEARDTDGSQDPDWFREDIGATL